MTALVFMLLAVAQSDFQAQGLKALDAQQFEQAIESFTKAVAADGKDYSAHFHLALANSFLNKDEEAIAGYRTTLELKPGLYEAEINLALLLIRYQKFADAAPVLRSAGASRPKEFRPAYYLGEALRETGKNEEALEAYERALGIEPDSPLALLGSAKSLHKLDKLDEAALRVKRAMEKDAAYRESLLELAQWYEDAKKPAEAIAIYREFPENFAAAERLGNLLVDSGRPQDAIAPLEAAVKASPTAANRYALATAYLRNKQTAEAGEQLRQAIAAEPQNFVLRMTLARLTRDQRQFPAAAQLFVEALKIKPDSTEALSELSGVLVLIDAYPQALAALDRLKSLGTETPGHLFLRAIALDKLHQVKPAIAAYQRFLATSGGKYPDEEFKARHRSKTLEREAARQR